MIKPNKRCNVMEAIAADTSADSSLAVTDLSFYISGQAIEYDLYIDDIRVELWERDETYKPLSAMKINEFRQMDVSFDLQTPGADHIEVKMTKNHFPFGGTIDKKMPEEMEDYTQFFARFLEKQYVRF